MTIVFEQETGLYVVDDVEGVVADGKTVVVDFVTFTGNKTDGSHLILTDVDDNVFVDIWGPKNHTIVLPFPKPKKLNGLKVATIDTGKVVIYLAQP